MPVTTGVSHIVNVGLRQRNAETINLTASKAEGDGAVPELVEALREVATTGKLMPDVRTSRYRFMLGGILSPERHTFDAVSQPYETIVYTEANTEDPDVPAQEVYMATWLDAAVRAQRPTRADELLTEVIGRILDDNPQDGDSRTPSGRRYWYVPVDRDTIVRPFDTDLNGFEPYVFGHRKDREIISGLGMPEGLMAKILGVVDDHYGVI